MSLTRSALLALIFMGLLAAFWGGTASAQGGKEIMIVVSTDENGELNPCG